MSYNNNYKNSKRSYSDLLYENAYYKAAGEPNPRYITKKIGTIGNRPALSGKLYKVSPQSNPFMGYASGSIYPQRQDLPAALRSSISKGHKSGNSTMPDYYRHSLELARKHGRRYKPLNKDDLAYAIDLDVRRRGTSALNDYYRYEKELASLGVNINGKWTRGKFGHDTGST